MTGSPVGDHDAPSSGRTPLDDGGEGTEGSRTAAASERGSPSPAPKIDPETLVLRARPRPVVRFRRGLLIASAAGLATALAAVAWVALQPAGLRLAGEPPETGIAADDPSPEALTRLPESYAMPEPGVPKLGPPLPGDLGRPILAHERAMAMEEGRPQEGISEGDAARQAALAERQRRVAELAEARSSPVLMQMSRGAEATPAPAGPRAPTAADNDAAPRHDKAAVDGTNPARLLPPASRWQLSAGTMISASLVTGLNSDVPGLVVAQVTEPAYDSATGRAVLVPQGARLLGRYDAKVGFGQSRALLVWDRLILPDGYSLSLGDAPATDAAGFAGVADEVDYHTGRLLRGIGLSTLLGVGTELTFGETEAALVRALRESVQTNAERAAGRIVERNLDIAPTITVRPGFPVRVLVHRDLVLPPWRGG